MSAKITPYTRENVHNLPRPNDQGPTWPRRFTVPAFFFPGCPLQVSYRHLQTAGSCLALRQNSRSQRWQLTGGKRWKGNRRKSGQPRSCGSWTPMRLLPDSRRAKQKSTLEVSVLMPTELYYAKRAWFTCLRKSLPLFACSRLTPARLLRPLNCAKRYGATSM